MRNPKSCFPKTTKGWEDYNKQYDIEKEDFIEELGNNGEELKDYNCDEDDIGCDIQHERAERDCGAR